MPRKRNPILGKAWDIIALSMASPMARMKQHSSYPRKLLIFKRTKKFKLIKHYNYAFTEEYEYSPSRENLLRYQRGSVSLSSSSKKRKRRIMSLLCGLNDEELFLETSARDEFDRWNETTHVVDHHEVVKDEIKDDNDDDDDGDDDDISVDQRAERFIEKFYEEIRIQRQKSISQYEDMLLKS